MIEFFSMVFLLRFRKKLHTFKAFHENLHSQKVCRVGKTNERDFPLGILEDRMGVGIGWTPFKMNQSVS